MRESYEGENIELQVRLYRSKTRLSAVQEEILSTAKLFANELS